MHKHYTLNTQVPKRLLQEFKITNLVVGVTIMTTQSNEYLL